MKKIEGLGERVTEKTNTLWAALKAAREQVVSVEKTSKNPMGFNYTSIDKMVETCRQALHDNNLVLVCHGWTLNEHHMTGTWTVQHTESLNSHSMMYQMPVPTGSRSPEKTYLGYQSSGLKYMLRDLLLLPMVDEAEVCATVDKPQKKAPLRKAPKKSDARQKLLEAVKVKTGLAGQDAVQATKTFLDESGIPSDGSATDEQLDKALDLYRSGK